MKAKIMKNKININKRERREKSKKMSNYRTTSPSNKNFLYMNLKFWI
jgi:hypothetical protein